MRRCAIPVLGVFTFCLPVSAFAGNPVNVQPDGAGGTNYSVDASEADSDWLHDSGDLTTRLGIDFTGAAGLGTTGGLDLPDSLIASVYAGIGYFIIPQVSTDFDLGGTFSIGGDEGFDATSFSLTPGARAYPIPEVFVRAGLPVIFGDSTSINVLGGLGYEYPLSDSQTLVGEIDLTYPLTEDGVGVITLGGGTTFSF
ncbi:MAG: hypothetical protein KC561_01180 [Myxococcales bacterium]|nr:hypothetical protein [Myxococcales bacterium]